MRIIYRTLPNSESSKFQMSKIKKDKNALFGKIMKVKNSNLCCAAFKR